MMKNSLLTIMMGCILLLVTCSCGPIANEASAADPAAPMTPVTSSPTSQPTPAPTTLQVTRVVSPAASLPAFDKTITDASEVQKLYQMALATTVIPKGARISCPLVPAQYQNVYYRLLFFHNKLLVGQMKLNASGCHMLSIASDPRVHNANNDLIIFFLKTIGRSSMLP
jgi:hypothetical protein